MALEYSFDVTTGSNWDAETYNYAYVTLIGADGKSTRTSFRPSFLPGGTTTVTIKTTNSLGELLLLRLEKDRFLSLFSEKQWFCSKIVVKTPDNEEILFPCYQWISYKEVVELRGGKAMKVNDETDELLNQRKQELKKRQETFQWKDVVKGISHLSDFGEPSKIPDELKFSNLRFVALPAIKGGIAPLYNWITPGNEFNDFVDMRPILGTPVSDAVEAKLEDDEFFAEQFLNGINPNVIKKCTKLPENFPVAEVVTPFLPEGSSLQEEIVNGNIFLCDQKLLDGISGRKYNDNVQLKMTAGLCLFYLKPTGKLTPIAIQLHQNPSEENPIFLPTDSKHDWLLAKIFFKNGDLILHEAIYHLTATHFLEESFAVATFRNFPAIHPLYKLLIPHFRYTIHINTIGRTQLMGTEGIFNKSTIGTAGVEKLMAKGFSEISYRSLCLRDNIADRGLESIPNFYYRDDGLKMWDIIKSFVGKVVGHYYTSDQDVVEDTELQSWINEVFTRCFLKKQGGFPESFANVDELVKFITMIIFTSTAQHAAVNNGQADFTLFVANAPLLVRRPPPTTKGQSSTSTILKTLPNKAEATEFGNLARVLSGHYRDAVFVGETYKDRFQEELVKIFIEQFQDDLSKLSSEIAKRNEGLFLPYTYLDPAQTENSIAT